MNSLQILETAHEFLNKYTHDSIKELILCLKKAKNGEYGPIYNRIDQSILFGFWSKYLEEKAAFIESQNLNLKAQESTKIIIPFSKAPESLHSNLSKEIKLLQRNFIKGNKEHLNPSQEELSPMQKYIIELKEWLPAASPEEIEGIKRQAELKGAKYVVTIINEYLHVNSNSCEQL